MRILLTGVSGNVGNGMIPRLREAGHELVLYDIEWLPDAEPFAGLPFVQGDIQQGFNLFGGNAQTLAVCEKYDLASILRGPLGMGMLTGKFNADSQLPADDIRRGWNFKEGGQAETLKRVESLRDVLTAGVARWRRAPWLGCGRAAPS